MSPESITYRQAHIGEARQIAELIARVREDAYDLQPGTPAYKHMITDQLSANSITSLGQRLIDTSGGQTFNEVALAPEKSIVGFVMAHRDEQYDELDYLFVDRKYQGKGIGSELLQRFGQWATRDQALWAVPTNTDAHKFYKQHGFQVVSQSTDSAIETTFTKMIRKR